MALHFKLLNKRGQQTAIVLISFNEELGRYIGTIINNDLASHLTGVYRHGDAEEIISDLAQKFLKDYSTYIEY